MIWIVVTFVAATLIAAVLMLGGQRSVPPRAAWGAWPDDDRDMEAIAGYWRARSAQMPAQEMDARSWEDLNMDDVFRILDRAESLVGQQALYARLRSVPLGPHLDEFDRLVTRFGADPIARDGAREALARIRRVDARDIWWLTQPGAFESAPWHVVFPVMTATVVAALIAMPFYPAALFVLLAALLASLLLRATAAAHIRVVGGAFRQLGALITAAGALRSLHAQEFASLTGALADDLPDLASIRRVAGWAGRDPAHATAGDISSMFTEYLNILLALDGNAVYFGTQQIRARVARIQRVVQTVGEIDATLSVASYRAGVSGWIRPTLLRAGEPLSLSGIRHPLLPDAVPNSIALAPPHGVIVTGSNMSGKTTFLRTLGVNVVLAQTICTCVADRYSAPVLVVRTCIGRADDPASGKSYYLVEVEAVLDLVRAAEAPAPHLVFDELFRGTNTIERVAAGEAVLLALIEGGIPGDPPRHVVMAATHDQELVDLLQGTYAPFHFTDNVNDTGLAFDYRLRPGPSVARNAIALLALRGAPAALIARATSRAGELDRRAAGRPDKTR